MIELEETEGKPYCALQLAERRLQQGGVRITFQLTSDGSRGNDFKMHQKKVSLDIGKKIPTKRIVQHRNRLPGKVVELPPLEVSKTFVNVSHRDVALW